MKLEHCFFYCDVLKDCFIDFSLDECCIVRSVKNNDGLTAALLDLKQIVKISKSFEQY